MKLFRDYDYRNERKTFNKKIPYYVQKNYVVPDERDELWKFELQLEAEVYVELEKHCRSDKKCHNLSTNNAKNLQLPLGMGTQYPLPYCELFNKYFGKQIEKLVYSFQRTTTFPNRRLTQNLNVPYFVKSDFRIQSQYALDNQIESHLHDELEKECFIQKLYRDSAIWHAKAMYPDLLTKAVSLEMPSCDRLKKFWPEN